MVLIAWVLWLAVVARTGCDADGDALHRLVLAAAPVAVAAAFMTRVVRPFDEVYRLLRWLSAVPLMLLPFVLAGFVDIGRKVFDAGTGICSGIAPAGWELAWLPAQIVCLAACGLLVSAHWTSSTVRR
jgi:hypothetical protein